MAEVEVPSYSYPGFETFLEVMKSKGGTVPELAELIGVKEWKVRSALSMLHRMGLIRKRRAGRRFLYLPVKGDLRGAYLSTFYRHLLVLHKPKDLNGLISSLWPGGKVSTSVKRAKYLVSLGLDLDVLKGKSSFSLREYALNKVFAKALLEAYRRAGGEYVSLTRIFDTLESWGLDREVAKKLTPRAVRDLRGRLTASPAISEDVKRDGILSDSGYLYYLYLEV